ncbi:MAG: 6-bladed beta-propeller [Gemmatimonadetes bacterium]|nr:6-bladed beta-propeller [Gemmatimonadota bacterium]
MNTLSLKRAAAGAALLGILFPGADASAAPAKQPAEKGGYTLQSVLAVGGADAADESFFYEKFGTVRVDADGAGNVYVLDNGNARVQVFDPEGNPLRTIGSEGEGPGEFQIPARLAVNEKGRVAVFDMGQARVSVFDETGALLWDRVAGEVRDLAMTAAGDVLLGFGKHGPAQVQAFDASGKLLWEGGELEPPGGMVIDIQLGGQTVAPRLAIVDGQKLFRTPEGEYRVQAFSLSGKALDPYVRAFTRQAVTAEDMMPPSRGDDDEEGGPRMVMIKRESPGGDTEDVDVRGGGGASFTTDDGETMELSMDRMKKFMPKHHPDTRGVLAWPDGRIWVITAEDQGDAMVTDEWSADGRWLRQFTVPADYAFLNVGRDGQLYAVTHDEDDYPTVHRLAVKRGA